MQTIKTVKNQTIFDIAIQHYGNIEAITEVLELNSNIRNNYSAAEGTGLIVDYSIFDAAFPLLEGQALVIDENSVLVKPLVLRELESEGDIVSFDKIDI